MYHSECFMSYHLQPMIITKHVTFQHAPQVKIAQSLCTNMTHTF